MFTNNYVTRKNIFFQKNYGYNDNMSDVVKNNFN